MSQEFINDYKKMAIKMIINKTKLIKVSYKTKENLNNCINHRLVVFLLLQLLEYQYKHLSLKLFYFQILPTTTTTKKKLNLPRR